MSDLPERLAALIEAGEEAHWTVLLDRALKSGAVPPTPEAKNAVLAALSAAVKKGLVVKVSTGTYHR